MPFDHTRRKKAIMTYLFLYIEKHHQVPSRTNAPTNQTERWYYGTIKRGYSL